MEAAVSMRFSERCSRDGPGPAEFARWRVEQYARSGLRGVYAAMVPDLHGARHERRVISEPSSVK